MSSNPSNVNGNNKSNTTNGCTPRNTLFCCQGQSTGIKIVPQQKSQTTTNLSAIHQQKKSTDYNEFRVAPIDPTKKDSKLAYNLVSYTNGPEISKLNKNVQVNVDQVINAVNSKESGLQIVTDEQLLNGQQGKALIIPKSQQVCIAANRPELARMKMEALRKQAGPNAKIIVVKVKKVFELLFNCIFL